MTPQSVGNTIESAFAWVLLSAGVTLRSTGEGTLLTLHVALRNLCILVGGGRPLVTFVIVYLRNANIITKWIITFLPVSSCRTWYFNLYLSILHYQIYNAVIELSNVIVFLFDMIVHSLG